MIDVIADILKREKGLGGKSGRRSVIPAAPNLRMEKLIVETNLIGELFKCHNRTIIFDNYIRTSVIRLLFRGGPAAVLRFIIAIIIDAVKTVSLGFRPHIFEERTGII